MRWTSWQERVAGNKKVLELMQRTAAMTDLILDLTSQLAKSLMVSLWLKKGIVAKTMRP